MPRHFVQVDFNVYYVPPSVCNALKENNDMKFGILGSIPELGSWQPSRILAAKKCPTKENVWLVKGWLPVSATFRWSWILTANDSQVVHWDPARIRETSLNYFNGILEATWGLTQTYFITQTCAINVRTKYHCQPGETLAMIGSEPSLGSWDSKKALRAKECPAKSSYWVAETLLDSSVSHKWKWVVLDSATGSAKRYEERSNRHLETNCDRLVIDARWGCESFIQHRIPVISTMNVDMTKQDISNFKQNSANDAKKVATKWIATPIYDKPFAVTESDQTKVKTTVKPRKPTWRSFIRRLPALLPIIGYIHDWCTLVE